jgi:hypothetical protein
MFWSCFPPRNDFFAAKFMCYFCGFCGTWYIAPNQRNSFFDFCGLPEVRLNVHQTPSTQERKPKPVIAPAQVINAASLGPPRTHMEELRRAWAPTPRARRTSTASWAVSRQALGCIAYRDSHHFTLFCWVISVNYNGSSERQFPICPFRRSPGWGFGRGHQHVHLFVLHR